MRLPRRMGASLMIAALLPAPALAAVAPERPPGLPTSGGEAKEEDPKPTVPGQVTLGSTLVVLPVVGLSLGGLTLGGLTVVGLGLPVALGAGHIYAGDPARGLAMGALAYPLIGVTTYATVSLGMATFDPSLPNSYSGVGAMLLGLGVGALTGVGYSFFMANDANETAARLDKERLAAPAR